MAEIHGCV